jgi:proline dehydrogenase
MLRSVLLYLSERKRLQNFVLNSKVARKRSRRFVAGETLDEAIGAVGDLNGLGMDVTLDHLGEAVESEGQARAATDDYSKILERLKSENGIKSTISIKPTQIGLAIDRDLCQENMKRVAAAARQQGNFVRMDMEASDYVDATLEVFYALFDEYDNIGAVIQSYLRRSEDDVRELARRGAPVRLCKGAYKEPEDLAFQKKSEINDSYVRLLEILMDSESPVGIATHDDLMLEEGKRLIHEHSDRAAPVEFQMLYGVRRDMHAMLVEEGYGMRIYVPYGNEWYPYFMRRMAERPANLLFVLRAMSGK